MVLPVSTAIGGPAARCAATFAVREIAVGDVWGLREHYGDLVAAL
jgi:hypothetical protein